MDSDDESLNPVLRADQADLWSAVGYLGEEAEEYDAATDCTVVRFARSVEWKDALHAIRKLLKKYHTSETLPMRTMLHKWSVLSGRLLPMIARYHEDRCVLFWRGG
jgi:hypothetical protein